MVRARDFGQKTQRGATSCKTDFRAKRASVPDLAHVYENWAKTWCAHVILAKKRVWAKMDMWASVPDLAHVHENWAKTRCAHVILAKKHSDFRAKRASVPDLAHVHENWAKTWCAHVILAKKRSAGQHRVKRTFGRNGHRYPTLLMYS